MKGLRPENSLTARIHTMRKSLLFISGRRLVSAEGRLDLTVGIR
jgi:hypothetical protein